MRGLLYKTGAWKMKLDEKEVQCTECGNKHDRSSNYIVITRHFAICSVCMWQMYPESAELLGVAIEQENIE